MRAVVMGGTSGIGLATAEHLASDKFDVTVTGRDPVKLAAWRAGSPPPSGSMAPTGTR